MSETSSKFHKFTADLSAEAKAAWSDVLAKIQDPAKLAEAEKAIADLADLNLRALSDPAKAEAFAAEMKFPLSTLASIAAEDVEVARERFRQAAWKWAQNAAHFAISVIAAV